MCPVEFHCNVIQSHFHHRGELIKKKVISFSTVRIKSVHILPIFEAIKQHVNFVNCTKLLLALQFAVERMMEEGAMCV